MLFHNELKEKTILKYKNLFGEDIYNNLKLFVRKDKIASNSIEFNYNNHNVFFKKDNYYIGYTYIGDIFYVSKEDLGKVKQHSWNMKQKSKNDYRLLSWINNKCIFLHRFILNLENLTPIVDHINRKQWDNRRENLRVCNNIQNSYNAGISKNKNKIIHKESENEK